MREWRIDQDYLIKEMSQEDFSPLYQKNAKELFESNSQILRMHEIMSNQEKEKLQLLKENIGDLFSLRLGVFYQGEFIGWHFGFQENAYQYYMANSAILEPHRRKGLYTKLLNVVIESVKKLGFHEIYSRHSNPNNAVIIPKLKSGFVISGMEVNDIFGSVVLLKYSLNDFRKKVFDYRTGHTLPDQEIKDHFHF